MPRILPVKQQILLCVEQIWPNWQPCGNWANVWWSGFIPIIVLFWDLIPPCCCWACWAYFRRQRPPFYTMRLLWQFVQRAWHHCWSRKTGNKNQNVWKGRCSNRSTAFFVRFNLYDNKQHIAAAIAHLQAAKAETAEKNCLPVIMSVNRGMAFGYTSCSCSLCWFVEKIRQGKWLTKREKLCILFYS